MAIHSCTFEKLAAHVGNPYEREGPSVCLLKTTKPLSSLC